jgi:mono/diheme cytochrome c family protein
VTDGSWELPLGTYLVKSFAIPRDARDPSRGARLIETRVLVRTSSGLVGSTFVWDDDQEEARASGGDVEIPARVVDRDGASSELVYRVAGTSQCSSCHRGRALGWRTSQLDVKGDYGEGRRDQLAHLKSLGLLDGAPTAPASLVDPFGDAPLDARARSYLDAHCSACHAAGGEAESTGLFWGVEQPLAVCRPTAPFGLGPPVLAPGQPYRSELLVRLRTDDRSARMPRGATHSIDEQGARLLTQWIAAMPGARCPD